MTTVVAKLLIAHLLGDSVFARRRKHEDTPRKWNSPSLALHALIQFLLAWLFLLDFKYGLYALVIGLSHYFSEATGRSLDVQRPMLGFFLEQLLHVLIIFGISFAIVKPDWSMAQVMASVPWVTLAGLLAVTWPTARILSLFLSQWPPVKSVEKFKGLDKAGLYIGIMERVMIFVFIVAGRWEGIGFLLAAKSIFRFGDLTNNKEMHLTEYIMVGTLLSFCIAILTGLVVVYLSQA